MFTDTSLEPLLGPHILNMNPVKDFGKIYNDRGDETELNQTESQMISIFQIIESHGSANSPATFQ